MIGRGIRIGTLRISRASRLRLRRTREGYGRSIDGENSGSTNLKPAMASGKALVSNSPSIMGSTVVGSVHFWIFWAAADAGHTSGACRGKRSFDDERLL